MAPKTSTFFDLKTCLRSKAPQYRQKIRRTAADREGQVPPQIAQAAVQRNTFSHMDSQTSLQGHPTLARFEKRTIYVLPRQRRNGLGSKASSWVSEAQGAVLSRGVTTCAGMTAHTVIVAQTKIAFLTAAEERAFLTCLEEQCTLRL